MKLTIASQITCIRILLVPFVVYLVTLQQWAWVIALFALAMITDYLDGFVARRYNQESRLGQLLDPIADKLLIMSSLYALLSTVSHKIVYFGIVFLIMKEMILLIGAAILHVSCDIFIKPSHLSRVASVAEMLLVVIVVGMHYLSLSVGSHFLQIVVLLFCGLSVALLIRYGMYILELIRRI